MKPTLFWILVICAAVLAMMFSAGFSLQWFLHA